MTRKTLIVSYDYKPSIGGQGVYVQNLEKHVHNKHLLVANGDKGDNVSVIKTRFMKGLGPLIFSKKLFFLLNKYIIKTKADVVHFQSGPGGVFLIKKPKAKVFATVHTSYLINAKYKKGFLKSIYYKIMKKIEKRSLHYCDRIIAISRMMKEEICKGYGIDERKVTILYNPVDDYFRNMQLKREKIILFVGRIEKQKGVMELAEAFKELNLNEYKLEFLGEGSYMKKLKDFIEANNLEGKILLKGKIKHEDLPIHYNKAMLCVMPSYFEALGLVAFESMYCNTPCIVSKNSGAAEIIEKVSKSLVVNEITKESLKKAIKENLDIYSKKPFVFSPQLYNLISWKEYGKEFERIRDEL